MPARSPLRHPWRTLRIALGVVLVAVGTLVTPTPVPVGLVVVATGTGILLVESRVARRSLYILRRRFPRFSALLEQGGRRLPARMRRILGRTDPFRRRPG